MKPLALLFFLIYCLSINAQQYINDDRLFEQGERKVYSGENLTNISFPMGGLGGGCIMMNGYGERNMWQIFNNFTQAKIPESFFTVQTKVGGEMPVTRQLQTSAGNFIPMDSLTFEGEYPLGWYNFYDNELPLDVEMEVFSPFIPLDAKNSALPCAIYTIKAKNNSSTPVDVSFLATQKNPIGYIGSPIYDTSIDQFPNQGNIFEDFEDGNYDMWTINGNAFNNVPNQQGMENFSGNYFAKSSKLGKGNLVSEEFVIANRYLHFKINGGRDVNQQQKIGLALVINGTIIKFATGSEQNDLYHDHFDLIDYQGETARLVIIDDRIDAFIGVDHIYFSDNLLNISGTVFEDFETSAALDDWTKQGNAFNNTSSTGAVGLQELRGFRGNGLLNSFDNGGNGSDGLTGQLTSPEFIIDKAFIYFLVGGGDKENTSINLLIDGEIVRSTSGSRRDILSWEYWNVNEFIGENVQIQIKDQNTNLWGHIVIDEIVFSDDLVALNELKGVGKNRNNISNYQGATLLHMTAESNAADMVLFTQDVQAVGTADIGNISNFVNEFNSSFNSQPSGAGPSENGSSITGALNTSRTLEPGESYAVSYVLIWSFPNYSHGIGDWNHSGNKYNTWWNNALDMAKYLVDNLDDLTNETKAYHEAMYESNLPHYAIDRITSQTAILKAKTAFWAADGVYGNWEGLYQDKPLGEGSCNHVVHYAQAHARLFPEVARTRRETTFGHQFPDGGFPHRHPDNIVVFDGQCGEILSCYREHLLTDDGNWLDNNWSKIKKAMDYVINRWDNDLDGLLTGPQWTTLDANVGGTSSWMGTLYLAALKASAEMAETQNDLTSRNLYNQIYTTGATAQDQLLWNGEYFIQVNDDEAERDYLTGSALDQLLGENWINQLGLPKGIYNKDRIKSALQSIYEYNFKDNMQGHTQLPRKFLDDGDGGLIMITWPNDGRPDVHPYYAAEIMTGFEYSTIATMINYGLLEEGFSALLAISDRYDGRIRENLDDNIWGFSGNPFGDDEWGKWYYRAMSSYSVLLAVQGFIYDGPKQKIGFQPKWQPEDHQSFFSASKGWGVFSQKYLSDGMEANIDLRYGQLDVKTIVLELENFDPNSIQVKVDNELNVPFELNENTITINLNQPKTVLKGDHLEILISGTVVGIENIESHNNELIIYPNPASELITFALEDDFKNGIFSIYSSLGELIDQRKINAVQHYSYSTNKLAAGTYLIQIENKRGGSRHGHFVIE